MRYENWDVILFPRDSHIPIQEFKTACYVSQDEYGHQLPTLICYIVSLPASTPFRISIHSWTSKAKPSHLIESKRKPHQRVVYTLRVVVDGDRVFHGCYEVSTKWPQEVAHEKRGIGDIDRQASQRKPTLQFPPFRPNVLMCSSWDARESNGRIKLFLSEQLISKHNGVNDLEFGASNDLICFSFQHAPREILEQAGISWPIRNPLFLPSAGDSHPSSHTPLSHTKPRNQGSEGRPQSPLSRHAGPGSAFPRPHNPEPHARPRTEPLPHFQQAHRSQTGERGALRTGLWEGSMGDSLGDPFGDVSMMDTWSTRQTSSNETPDISMTDLLASPPSSKAKSTGHNPIEEHDKTRAKALEEHRRKREREERQVVMALRDDQFETLIGAISPPKKGREREQGSHGHDQDHKHFHQATSQAPPPRMGPTGPPMNTRPSAAALARTSSYPDFHPHIRNTPHKSSPTLKEEKRGSADIHKSPLRYQQASYTSDKENCPPNFQAQEKHIPTPHPTESRVPTPYPFAQNQGPPGHSFPKFSSWESDVEMRDPSSLFSSLSRREKETQQLAHGKGSPAHMPAASGGIKSRKEGLGIGSPASTDPVIRHDKSLLPSPGMSVAQEHARVPQNTPVSSAPLTRIENIVDVHETKPFVPGHRSNEDSIGKIEQQLWSALGDELTSFETAANSASYGHNGNVASMDVEGGGLSGLEELESPVMKRKRKGTMGGERGRSPSAKVMKEGGVSAAGGGEGRGDVTTIT
ncbi:uncharacterized protein BDR25DRAFT_278949 [Lindgomyces ingoldianus]|uniref:Uncharacterized protein n=1 Tax=Lindgomyces ingoldianus TaxID=673940 RepID=A0ACB6RBK1_9PLEO|nr:uncharacterized protein BDR25DRAFT_278949 [Lindgomyces ingoldianus]KAF2476138.1 hypothetical protein BDR25DRAFT_278949 [Lindgomyces ingoldianus]